MTRTKLKDRQLPNYSKNEELFNMVSHIVGGAVGIAGMVLCIIRSVLNHNGFGLAGSIVFGVSMILLYTVSSVYHGLHASMGKRVMQVVDHCTIYVLISGTYTPVSYTHLDVYKRQALTAQLARYAACPQVERLLVLAPRGVDLPNRIGGKPVTMMSLEKLWGISLP